MLYNLSLNYDIYDNLTYFTMSILLNKLYLNMYVK